MQDQIWYTSSCGKIEFTFKDLEQVYSMHHAGDCEESVKAELPYFLEKLQAIPRETIVSVLVETGGWDSEELEDESDTDLYIKLLWIASGDVHDNAEMNDLCEWQNDFMSDRT